ncbi:sugar ABC transporter ATP-binding protein [Polystyrenella longa]|uniref:sugar ABC transporter ATP-binding protein n=1 Tax=Polystyrenella longa TaxID=2528007 RepID=UPI0018D271DF|nr:sugar ABC transporter ATP-binding protein [Polystyrenella longa]
MALKPLDLSLGEGEILGLVGENGAGKSTLIKLLSGLHSPDSGTIRFQGKPVEFPSPREALETGIATIHQELEYAAHLTVAENMLLGEPWPRTPWWSTDWQAVHNIAQERLQSFGIEIATDAQFESLSAVQKQEVAIANALARKAKLLILDEPSAALTEPEIKRLFGHLKRLRKEGVSMIYVSHRLDEIFELTNHVAILREGTLINHCPTVDITAERMVAEMVGRDLEQVFPHRKQRLLGLPLLELENVTRNNMFYDISFSLHAGEILGLAGLVGAGRSELARAIYGLYPIESGQMHYRTRLWKPSSAQQAVESGLVYIPEERKRQALVLDHSLNDSISIGFSRLVSRFGFISLKKEREKVDSVLKTYDVRSAGREQSIGQLSGGNQQKAILGRWFERNPEVIILDEPTRGIDIGAKAQIHSLIEELADKGKAILLISSDLPEVLAMSDRVLVMNRGRIETELTGDDKTEQNVVLAASGLIHDGKTT